MSDTSPKEPLYKFQRKSTEPFFSWNQIKVEYNNFQPDKR